MDTQLDMSDWGQDMTKVKCNNKKTTRSLLVVSSIKQINIWVKRDKRRDSPKIRELYIILHIFAYVAFNFWEKISPLKIFSGLPLNINITINLGKYIIEELCNLPVLAWWFTIQFISVLSVHFVRVAVEQN